MDDEIQEQVENVLQHNDTTVEEEPGLSSIEEHYNENYHR